MCKVGDDVIYNNYPDPFWIEALEDVNVNYYYYNSGAYTTYYGKYSYDKINWTSFAKEDITLRTGTKIYIIADVKFQRLYVSGKYNVGGSLLSLVYGANYLQYNSHLQDFFRPYDADYFFSKAQNVIEAKELVMPTVLERFTSSANGQYYKFFCGCNLLKSVPRLPATTMQQASYEYMFYGCESLTKAPTLSESTANRCYRGMFIGCTNLSYIKMMSSTSFSSDTDGWSCGWVSRVSPTGTFIASSKRTDFTRGVNGIPEGWDLYLYDEDNDRYVVKFKVNNIPYEMYTDEPRNVTWKEFVASEQNTNGFVVGDGKGAIDIRLGNKSVLYDGMKVGWLEDIVLNGAYTLS